MLCTPPKLLLNSFASFHHLFCNLNIMYSQPIFSFLLQVFVVKSRSLLKWTFLLIQTSLGRVHVVCSSSTVSQNNLQ